MPEGTKRVSVGGEEEPAKRPKVVWKVEDPSEFRRQEELENLGKDAENFRVFTNVSSRIATLLSDSPGCNSSSSSSSRESQCIQFSRHPLQKGISIPTPCMSIKTDQRYHECMCFVSTLQESDPRYPIVKKTYTEMHSKQTVEFVRGKVGVLSCEVLAGHMICCAACEVEQAGQV